MRSYCFKLLIGLYWRLDCLYYKWERELTMGESKGGVVIYLYTYVCTYPIKCDIPKHLYSVVINDFTRFNNLLFCFLHVDPGSRF